MAPRHQAQPARRGKIERPRIARNFADHESEVATAQPLFKREQGVLHPINRDMDQAVAQGFGQTRPIGPTRQTDRRLVLHPQPGTMIDTLVRRIDGQRQRKRRTARLVGGGKDLGMVTGPARFAAQARSPACCAPIIPDPGRGTTRRMVEGTAPGHDL